MSVLEKLRIPSENDEEIGDEMPEEIGSLPPLADESKRDPSPGEPPGRRARAAAAKAPTPMRVTKKHIEEATEEIETFVEAIALAWGWQAPPCGEALEAAAPEVAAKVAKLASRNPRWLARVRDGGILADALGIAVALKPVARVAWTHYTAPSGGDDGRVVFDPAAFPAYDGR